VGFEHIASGVRTKAIEFARPLKGNDPAFNAGEQIQAEGNGSDTKAQCHDPWLGAELYKHHMQQGGNDVANNQDREIGRAVIGAVMM
jgi:hypothetical protein